MTRPQVAPADLEAGLAHAVADELIRLTEALGAMAASLGRDPAIVRRHMQALQQVDEISQVHGEIAGLLRASGSGVARLSAVRLEALKRRLQRAAGAGAAAPPPAAAAVPATTMTTLREERFPVRADIRVWVDDAPLASLGLVDLSPGGIGTEGLIQLEVGTAVRVEFPDGTMRPGRAVWRDGFCAGIHFDEELDGRELDRLRTTLLARPFFPKSVVRRPDGW